ncbi:MAG: DUF4065 domain-containing protein [bacterium]
MKNNDILNKVAYCQTCDDDVSIHIETATLQGKFKGNSYVYEGEIEKCDACGHDVEDEEIEKQNLKALQDIFRINNQIIFLDNIRNIPEKYDIGKRPLSILLEWGELTFTRYYDGDIPSKSYSNTLEEIYNNPQKYLEVLEANKHKISQKAYKKSLDKTTKLLRSTSKISDVLNYILYNCKDITPLSAQKLLYYCQGFYYAFFNNTLFEEDCFAGIDGPIFISVYENYKNYIYPEQVSCLVYNLDNDDRTSNLSVSEKIICDSVIKNMGCYSGNVLTKFTTLEMPCITARGKLSYTSEDKPLIQKSNIFDYFGGVVKKYDMISATDINVYSKKMFELN